MNFYPHRMINPGEIKVHHVVSPVDVDNWNNPKIKQHVIDALFSYFEQMAFIRDYVILGPAYLKSDELAQYVEELNGAVPYLVELSAPMMRAEDWERWTVYCDALNCIGLMCPYDHSRVI